MAGLLDLSTIDELHGIYREGMQTVQDWQEPPPIVQFRRRPDGERRFVDVGDPVHLISIKFANRDADTDPPNEGRSHTESAGELKAFAPVDIRRDDRFTWQGHTCYVVEVLPERLGIVRAAIRMLQDVDAPVLPEPEEPEVPDGP